MRLYCKKKYYLALLFNILMALFRVSTAFLKFGTFSADVSGKLGIFWEGGGGTGRREVGMCGFHD